MVDFHNTRDVAGAGWPDPEVEENMNTRYVGDMMKLAPADVDDVVAFLMSLTDDLQMGP